MAADQLPGRHVHKLCQVLIKIDRYVSFNSFFVIFLSTVGTAAAAYFLAIAVEDFSAISQNTPASLLSTASLDGMGGPTFKTLSICVS